MRGSLVQVLALAIGALFVVSMIVLVRSRPPRRGPALGPGLAAPIASPERSELELEASPIPRGDAPLAPPLSASAAQRLPGRADDIARVTGRVLELALGDTHPGVPAPGVVVVLRDGLLGPLIAKARTDADGRFAFELEREALPRQASVLVAEDERFRAERAAVRPAHGETVEVELRRAPHGHLVGRTVDTDGRALGEVALLLDGKEPEELRYEVLSDLTGRFELDVRERVELRGAARAGYVLERWTPARQQPRGGMTEMEVVLAPAGELELVALDAGGAPRSGVTLSLGRAGFADSGLPRSARRRQCGPTDASGRALHERVWTGWPLDAVLDGDAGTHEVFGVVDGELALAADPRAEPLLVRPGERLTLIARLDDAVRVTGIVLSEQGRPVPGAQIRIWEPGRPSPGGGIEHELLSDGEGRFTQLLPAAAFERTLRVTAHYEAGFNTRELSSPGTLELPAGTRHHEVELRLAPTLAIEGRVVFPAGEARSVHVRAVRAGAKHVYADTARGEEAETRTNSDGAFVLDSLPAGSHDLIVIDGLGALGDRVQRFPGIPAGARDVVLALEVERDVRVRFVTPDGARVTRMAVAADRLYPIADGSVVPAAGRRIERLVDFPPIRRPESQLVQARIDEAGSHRLRGAVFQGGTGELRATSAGWYSFGVLASDAEGTDYALVAGGPYWLGPGEHEFEVALTPTGRITGHLTGGDPDMLALALLDPAGRRLPLRLRVGEVATTASFTARGHYRLEGVPVGTWQLAIGPESELERGRALRTFDVTVESGVATQLDLELR